MAINLLKSLLHNVGVVIVSLAFAYLGTIVDSFLRLPNFSSPIVTALGVGLISLGFFVRVWEAIHFYAHQMRVISLEPQDSLVTSGPFRYSRNPLYLGGNVFFFLGRLVIGITWRINYDGASPSFGGFHDSPGRKTAGRQVRRRVSDV